MELRETTIESFMNNVEGYSKTTFELSKLKLLESAALVAASLVPCLIVILMLLLSGLVLSIGIALFLGDYLGTGYYGFFIVGAFYLLTGIILHFFLPRWMKKPISNMIIKQALQ